MGRIPSFAQKSRTRSWESFQHWFLPFQKAFWLLKRWSVDFQQPIELLKFQDSVHLSFWRHLDSADQDVLGSHPGQRNIIFEHRYSGECVRWLLDALEFKTGASVRCLNLLSIKNNWCQKNAFDERVSSVEAFAFPRPGFESRSFLSGLYLSPQAGKYYIIYIMYLDCSQF